jgi:hypothetical protein
VSSHVVTLGKRARRLAYGLLAGLLLAAVVLEAVKHGSGYWQIAVFALAPDLALLVGAGEDLERGRIHPRAVRLYNLAHRFWGPIALGIVAATGLVAVGYLVGALAWGLHIALDRSLGYGLRTPDGRQRP